MMKAKFLKSKSSNPKKLKKKFQKQKCYSKNEERMKKRRKFFNGIFFLFLSSLFFDETKNKIKTFLKREKIKEIK